ncbi:MAG: hypothetical protein C4B59_13725 [Candidatus Methanogaster sp.]|uniref:Uncharacterized protein n=1 Tax=Candidatus Methanogaster sp. TaxID=3386292 RepID=A0AC61KZM3_9EURY|nr:MAG: hypothetical protein C4B59_13725 [ANME-2 cluster archaeon]
MRHVRNYLKQRSHITTVDERELVEILNLASYPVHRHHPPKIFKRTCEAHIDRADSCCDRCQKKRQDYNPRPVHTPSDKERLRENVAGLLDVLLTAHQAFVDSDGLRCPILDEVQRIPGWERWVRIQQELCPDLVIIVSGPSAELLPKELATLLTGRHLDPEVFPLDFSEYLRFHGIDPDDTLADSGRIKSLASEYISESTFLAVVLTPDPGLKERDQNKLKNVHDLLRSAYTVDEKVVFRTVATATVFESFTYQVSLLLVHNQVAP